MMYVCYCRDHGFTGYYIARCGGIYGYLNVIYSDIVSCLMIPPETWDCN